MSNTSYYVGAYAIVHVPQRVEQYDITKCPNGCYLGQAWKHCSNCGSKVINEIRERTVATTLYDLEEEGKLEVEVIEEGKVEISKYTQVHYTVDSSIDEPFSNEPLVLISNSDDETDIDFDDSDDTLPYHIITNIKEEHIVRCKANFIRLYFDELRQLGETTVEFGILKRVEF